MLALYPLGYTQHSDGYMPSWQWFNEQSRHSGEASYGSQCCH